MSSSTYEGRKKTKNGVKRLIFSALSILLQLAFFVILFTRLNRYAEVIDISTRLLAVVLVLKIYGKHTTSSMKTPWIILIMLLPILGVALYLLVGLNGSTRVMRERYAKIDGQLAPYLTSKETLLEELKEQNPKAGGIASYIINHAHYPLYRNTDVTFYPDAAEGLAAQLHDLASAEHFIFMEYHAIEEAEAFGRIKDVLAERAAHGVEVRLFYDDVGSIGFIDPGFIKRMEAIGVECRVFNPVVPILNIFIINLEVPDIRS